MKSIKAEWYDKYELEKTNEYLKLCYDYSELSLSFQWLMKAHTRYILDSNVARVAKIVNENCHKFCSYCKNGRQQIEHWYVKFPTFITIRYPVSGIIRRIYHYFYHTNSNINNNENKEFNVTNNINSDKNDNEND
ncbi:hypothetical protein PIROE2DRAFT_3408 [Piromyces sp. E2]|nr:hypothetical protein PIROE2DRAFT_3408 [Piromyces sp. E2]|eukprot:OUM68878.1 hypothetical protein PIROE2DRAFT_3408 [Piromyces sp. E2]